ncbi:MAG: hypothetical protein KatS3mg032_0594 [Cyclobacteriaceae bacterium]|nr:MAG: hypothetical protein KatS3mg032_0594 [Cyclobacteriaceae bacterium]
MPLRLSATCMFVLLCACQTSVPAQQLIEKYASRKLSAYELLYNTSKSHVIAVEKTPNTATGRLSFLIFDTTSGELLEEGSFRPGYIKWVSNEELEIFDAPGIVQGEENQARFIKRINLSKLQ